MNASEVIKLKLARMGSYTHPYKTVDASTYTWQKQLATPHYVAKTPLCGEGGLYDPASLSPCTTCGQGASVALTTNASAVTRKPNNKNGQMGSGTRIYSSESVTLQRASRAVCATATLEPSAIIVPSMYCDSNSAEAPNINPYQPTFATQLLPSCTNCYKGMPNANALENCQCNSL